MEFEKCLFKGIIHEKNLRKVCRSRFSTEFILEMYIIAQTYLRFCKNKPKPYWNTTSGFEFFL